MPARPLTDLDRIVFAATEALSAADTDSGEDAYVPIARTAGERSRPRSIAFGVVRATRKQTRTGSRLPGYVVVSGRWRPTWPT